MVCGLFRAYLGWTGVAEGACPPRLLTADSSVGEQTGGVSECGRVWGTYLHGLFDSDGLRDVFLEWITGKPAADRAIPFSYARFKEENYDRLADVFEAHVDIDPLLECIGCR